MAAAIAHQQLRADQAVATDYALRGPHRLNGLKTFGADRNARNIVERSAAKPAIRGEKDGKNISQEGLHRHDEDGTLLGALLSSFSFYRLTTAEDDPPTTLAQIRRKIEPMSPAPRDAEGLVGLSPVP